MNLVVKALIEELAKKGDDEIQLTPEQEAISIRKWLVYLAGLLFVSSSKGPDQHSSSAASPPYPKVLRDRFEEYQYVYYDAVDDINDDSKGRRVCYALSPRMVPTKKQQACIDQDFKRKSDEMESLADAAGEGLQEAENGTKANSEKTKLPSKKKKNPTIALQADNCAKIQPQESTTTTTARKQLPSETLEELQQQFQKQNASVLTSDDDDDNAWITVSKKGSNVTDGEEEPASPPIINRLQETTTTNPSIYETQKKILATANEPEDQHTPCVGESDTEACSSIELLSKDDATISNCEPSVTPDSNNHDIIERLQERVRLLEKRLSEKEDLLQQERNIHAKALRDEKEKSDDHVQSMQLRLYISETRLKTYQDALDQHIQAVAANVASNSYPSPLRKTAMGGETGNTEQQQAPSKRSSPLISRMLQQRNRLQEDEN